MGRCLKLCLLVVAALGLTVYAAAPAWADDWLPHPVGAHWQYVWTDSTYNSAGTVENVDVEQQSGTSFTLAWADSQHQPPSSTASFTCPQTGGEDIGTASFQDAAQGLLNTDWASCPPPSAYPPGLLCTGGSTSCPDHLSSVLFNLIWGNRLPVLSEPLLQGLGWNSTGGSQGNVQSTSHYLGLQVVKVPAFPSGVTAAAVQTDIALAGTPGDAYGSGERTVWWVYGVGPVRVAFDHADGSITNAYLKSTNLSPRRNRADQDYFSLHVGVGGTYRWTNNRHMTKPETDKVVVAAVAGQTARIDVKSVSGPIRAAAEYGFTFNLTGLTNIWGVASAASAVTFPTLGHGRHFFTPLDLLLFGFNPMLPAYPVMGTTWHSGNQRDLQLYGVTGWTNIVGVVRVKVPAGTFQALELRSSLTQPGHPFGSGTRTVWFAPHRGLVKLVFRHRDRSTSTVELVK